jgi:fatty acid desaturase
MHVDPELAPTMDEFKRPEFQRQVNRLRQIDNVTNWFYIAREYLLLGLVLSGPLIFYHYYETWNVSWVWGIPITLLAILLVGTCQHRIANLGHEGSHYALFRNRTLNELAANWFAIYPLWSLTHAYRLQHLAHHQYLNDDEKDPDMVYMNYLGQSFKMPMPARHFLWACVFRHFVWAPNLLRYIFERAKLANSGGVYGPYKAQNKPSKLIPLTTLVHLGVLLGLLGLGVWQQSRTLIVMAPLCLLPVLFLVTLAIPERFYMKTAVKPDIPAKWAIFQRTIFTSLLFTMLAWMTLVTGKPWPVYYFLLWLVPLATTLSFFMILREDIQHSNTEPGRFSESRDFRGNPLVRWSVFPMGQAYHLSHHLFPMVPHYNLKKLDDLLRHSDVYRLNAIVIDRLIPPHAMQEG